MNPPLPSWFRFAPGHLIILLTLAPFQAKAQCPLAVACTPGRASSPLAAAFDMGILNVTVGNKLINKTTMGQAEGYRDYSCTENATLIIGQSCPISIQTNANTPENVRVWIDYNNDSTFAGNDELAFSSDNKLLHAGTFTPPASATLGVRLRMRVAADYANGPVPAACSTPEYSQTEDYSVTLAANAHAPAAAFTTNATTTCTGCVQFTDASQNLPTAWRWDFGDGTTSTVRHPSHCYSTAGTYAATLRATNAAGTHTSAATSIVYTTSVPAAASCSPPTISYFANYGITRFRLGTIDNRSADGSAGYEDFTCPHRTELTVGLTYPLAITTGGVNRHDIQVYLDKNNDGSLTAAELVFQNPNTASPGATTVLTLPAGTVLNQPLRLRVVADAVGHHPAGPCTAPVSGQVEDYTVVARANAWPPVASFRSSYGAGGCVNPIEFTDLSTNYPTTWLWDFGDGTTSTQQHPTHRYAATGSYNVSLVVTNAYGTASATGPGAMEVAVPCLTYCAANGTGGVGPGGTPQPSPFFITSVSVPNAEPAFSNATANSPTGYGNLSAPPIAVHPERQVTLSVASNLAVVHRTAVWVDWNANGVFDAAELVADGVTTPGPAAATFTARFGVPVGAIGRTVRLRVLGAVNTTFAGACEANLLNAEVEDYQLQVLPVITATRDALTLPALSLYPTPTTDGYLRLRLTDASTAGLYTTEVQNLLGATLLSTPLRLGPAADAKLDLSALAPGVYVLRLRDAHGHTALRRVVRE